MEQDEVYNALQRIAIDYSDALEGDEDHNLQFQIDDHIISNQHRRSKRKHISVGIPRKVNMQNRMKGKRYFGFSTISQQKDERKAREVGPMCTSSSCMKSKLRQCKKFNNDIRKQIFKSFWNMSWEAKRVFVRCMVTPVTKKRSTVENSRKHFSYQFKLPFQQISLQVCRKMFLATLSIKPDMIRGWIKTPNIGNQQSLNRVANAGRITYLREYFENLNPVESHYCRRDTGKKYIEATFKTKSDVYKDYQAKCLDKQVVPVSIFTFSTVFAELNLALYMPRKDQCDTCVGFKAHQVSKDVYDAHVSKQQRAKLEKSRDKLAAVEGRRHVLTMDVQAVKLCPDINASAIYFKQRLQVHNFTIFNLATHQCSNYWWNETDGDLSASSFVSCIIHYLKAHCLNDTLPITIFSDGCGYQNRNQYLSNALSNFAIQTKKIIEQKYLEKGHTQMECDSAHAKIEKKLKNRSIYLPYDYVSVTKEARTNVKIDNVLIKKPFDVEYLKYDFFLNYSDKQLLRFASIRPGKKKYDPTVSDLRSLIYLPNGHVMYKVNFDEEYVDLPIRIKPYECMVEPRQLHADQLPIKQSKWQHLQDLKTVIPQEYHSFYDNIRFVGIQ